MYLGRIEAFLYGLIYDAFFVAFLSLLVILGAAIYELLLRVVSKNTINKLFFSSESYSEDFPYRKALLAILVFVPFMCYWVLAVVVIIHSNKDYGILSDIVLSPLSAIILSIAIGTAAYYARCRYQLYYAIFEFLVGVAISVQASFFKDQAGFLRFAAGVYIIVRAFDNFEKGLSKKNLHDWWKKKFGLSQT